jgi:hypothetical protein
VPDFEGPVLGDPVVSPDLKARGGLYDVHSNSSRVATRSGRGQAGRRLLRSKKGILAYRFCDSHSQSASRQLQSRALCQSCALSLAPTVDELSPDKSDYRTCGFADRHWSEYRVYQDLNGWS